MNTKFNQWANELKVGSRYQPKLPTPNAHYFDVDVFKQNLNRKAKYSFLSMLKRMLGIAVVCGLMSSCSTYTGIKGSNGCGVWFKKKYDGSAPVKHNTRMISF